jgi:PKD domain
VRFSNAPRRVLLASFRRGPWSREASANLFTDVDGPDNVFDTADDDFSVKPNSLAIDVGMDPRTLGFNPSYNPSFEADFVIEGIRPADGIAVFDAGAFEFVSPNQAPIAHAGIDRTVIAGSLVNLDGSASFDPDGNAITYQWTQTGGPVVSLSSPTVVNPALDQLMAAERERYGALFNQLGDLLTNLGADRPTLQAIYLDAGHAKYRLRREQTVGGVPTQITYYVYSSIDSDGIWRIDSF